MPDLTFAYTIIYVPDVEATVAFFESAFDMQRRFVSDDGTYGELNTGGVTLSFASETLADSNLPDGYLPLRPDQKPAGFEIGFTTDNVSAAVERAVAAGAVVAAEPTVKPWGQTVAYVRDLNGVLIEICTPVGG